MARVTSKFLNGRLPLVLFGFRLVLNFLAILIHIFFYSVANGPREFRCSCVSRFHLRLHIRENDRLPLKLLGCPNSLGLGKFFFLFY